MAAKDLRHPWFDERPELAEEIERDLREHYPSLRLAIADGKAEVRGTFPVVDEVGRALDRWQVAIELPADFPDALPIVRETGGRLVCSLANHVVRHDGTACVLLPESRYKWFPRGARLLQYLDGPLRAYFTNQSYRANGGEWTHDEWAHGALAAVDFYKKLLNSHEDVVGWRGVVAMALGLKDDQPCPCGGRKAVRDCHPELIAVRDNLGADEVMRRLADAVESKLKVKGAEALVAILVALGRGVVKGHHSCPCGSGARVRDCHPLLRELNGAVPRIRKRPRGGR